MTLVFQLRLKYTEVLKNVLQTYFGAIMFTVQGKVIFDGS